MIRPATYVCLLLAGVSGLALYQSKHRTHLLDREIMRTLRATAQTEERIAVLAEEEELGALRPDLDGNAIMEVLGVGPGRVVGQAYAYLLERRIDEGPLGPERAREELLAWWAQQPR